jgi:O-antigen ligase
MRAAADPLHRLARPLDLTGIGLVAVTVGWAMLVSGTSGGSARPFVWLVIGATVGLGLSRWLEGHLIRSVPLLVVGGAGAFFVLAWLESGRWGDPLGYANASAALSVEAMVAALMLLVGTSPLAIRIVGMLGVLVFGATPFVLDARTAAFLVVVIALSFGVSQALRWPRRGIAVAAIVLLLALVTTIGLGASGAGEPGSITARVVDTSLTEARVALWHDALDIVADHPITGVGWGGFATTSPIARSDEDLRHAHHEFLQVAAESGIPGGLLLVLLFACAFARIYVASSPDATAVLGAIALAAVGVSASVDYVLRFPAVGMTAAFLVGAAQAGQLVATARRGTRRSAEFEVPA